MFQMSAYSSSGVS